eukprot:TRINITY_DN3857_c0_g1_i6.p2 TRINITY_DN3857_c0_g1~~TRINITY_DN3857_c0_g1_i6.p2  ORF type:complete len:178 (+),score=48.78 TRINITY_DN3857_c0_g1_i6:356-889(+)
MVTKHPELDIKCEDLAKPILHLQHAINSSLIDKARVRKIMHLIIKEFFGRASPSDGDVTDFIEVENAEAVEALDFSIIFEEFKQKYLKDATKKMEPQELKQLVFSDILKKNSMDSNLKNNIKPVLTAFNHEHFKFSLTSLEKTYTYFVGEDIDRSVYVYYLWHAGKYKNSYERIRRR